MRKRLNKMRKKVVQDYTPKYFPPKTKVLIAPSVKPEKVIIAGVAYYELVKPTETKRFIPARIYEEQYGIIKKKRKRTIEQQ